MMKPKKSILLVEDPAGAAPEVRCVLADLGLGDRVVSATSSETLRYLKIRRQQQPCVVLLIVNESDDDRLATLKTIKQDEQLRSVPVVVLGPSGNQRMVEESFGLGAAGYMAKTTDHSQFSATMRAFYEYWSLSEIPQ